MQLAAANPFESTPPGAQNFYDRMPGEQAALAARYDAARKAADYGREVERAARARLAARACASYARAFVPVWWRGKDAHDDERSLVTVCEQFDRAYLTGVILLGESEPRALTRIVGVDLRERAAALQQEE